MDRLRSYCARNGYEVMQNHGGGITIIAPFEKRTQIVRYFQKLKGVSYNELESWCNHDYTYKMMPVFPAKKEGELAYD